MVENNAGKGIRASTLPRLRVCPSSLLQSVGKLNPTSIEAAFGTAYHAVMDHAAKQGRAEVPVEEIAARHGVDPRELRRLYDRFSFDPQGWNGEEAVELDLGSGRSIRGRIDAWQEVEKGEVEVVDYKTTHRVEEDPEPWADPQTQAYGLALWDRLKPKVVRTMKAYPRRGDEGWSAPFEITEVNAEVIRAELLDIVENAEIQFEVAEGQRRYVMSHHCDYCPGRVDCPAVRREYVAIMGAVQKFSTGEAKTVDVEITTENVGTLHMLYRLLGKARNAINEGVRSFVEAFGPIEVEGGKFLAVKPTPRRQSLSEPALWEAVNEIGESEEEKALAREIMEGPPPDRGQGPKAPVWTSEEIEAWYAEALLKHRSQVIARCLEWVRNRPKRIEQRLDIYSASALEGD